MTDKLKIYACKHFNGIWVNGVAVIVAESSDEALDLLKKKLESNALYECDMQNLKVFQVPTDSKDAHILFDIDY
jgi:hypothetical protein